MEGKWEVWPVDEVEIGEEHAGELRIWNKGTETGRYRIKTNAPTVYSISPSQGSVDPDSHATILISLKPLSVAQSRHKFQVLLTPSSGTESQLALLTVSPVSLSSIPPADPGSSLLESTHRRISDLSTSTATLLSEVKFLKQQLATANHKHQFSTQIALHGKECSAVIYQAVLGLVIGLVLSRVLC